MVAEFLMAVGASLTANAIDRKLQGTPSYFEKRKIASKLDEIVIAVMEPIAIFFEVENIPEADLRRIAGEAIPVAEWLIENPKFAFSRGLEGEVITRDILKGDAVKFSLDSVSDYPAAFETLLRALVDLVVKVPPVFAEWEKTAFQAVFRQTEEIRGTLASMYSMMQKITSSQKNPLGNFEKVVNHRAATSALKMSIHGLRQSAVPQAELDNLFVFPEFSESVVKTTSKDGKVTEEDECVKTFKNFNEFYELVSESQSCIVRAPAGAGKTTFSNWLASKLLICSDVLFPVVLPLRKTLKSETLPGLFECISGEVSSVFQDMIDAHEVTVWADEKKIVVIFEGFDEVSEKDRDRAVEWIQELKTAHPNLSILITSRPLSTPHLSDLTKLGWRDISLLPFDLPRVITYIEYFQKYGPEMQTGAKLQAPKHLAKTWNSDPTLGPLTGNPLLLSTLLVVHHMDGELPDDRSKLYDRYIDGMLGLWELNKELVAPTVPLTKEQKKKILELIAVNMISLETDTVSENDVAQWLQAYLLEQNLPNDVLGILDHLRERSGLLIGPGQYTFAHKSIGEFLVAQACSDGIQTNFAGDRFDRFLLADKCLMDRWTTVIFLWAGLAAKTEVQQFIEKLIAGNHNKLAGGLLLERRKFLDRKWLKVNFWRWVSIGLGDGGLFNEKGNLRLSWPSITKKASTPSGEIDLHIMTTVVDDLTSEATVMAAFFSDKICDPEDWNTHSLPLNETFWWLLSHFVEPTLDFLKAAPITLTQETKCCSLFGNQITGRFPLRQYIQEFSPYKAPECASCDPLVYEPILFLDAYSTWKFMMHQVEIDELSELPAEGDGSGGKRPEGKERNLALKRYWLSQITQFTESGFFDIAISRSVEDLPTEFFSLFNDALPPITPIEGNGKFSQPDTKPITFAERCKKALDLNASFPRSQECDDFVSLVLKRNEERNSSQISQ
ncbi:NACHT domain-containing protein [Parasedimentitalea psychrophila]|uniref:NACHT domain-containing protein n=1 Tax=Parasedimentitalea psychrophila TaxID=2997337 RepID=A0A9Y2KX84_9RHOB|nr:NACHT domain-containing protein [Parasedimentitalea psychrophila]WIY24821.1 NACHT domain-containing protein [Parasedimentitalea psychrophila]